MKRTTILNTKQIIICSGLWPDHYENLKSLEKLTGVSTQTLSRLIKKYRRSRAVLSEVDQAIEADVKKMALEDMIAEVQGTTEDPEKLQNDLKKSGDWQGY